MQRLIQGALAPSAFMSHTHSTLLVWLVVWNYAAATTDAFPQPLATQSSTYLRCCGHHELKRACLAYYLYYNIQQRNFVAMVDDPTLHVANDYKLKFWNVTVANRTTAPDLDKTLVISGFSVFWHFYNFWGASNSIGHSLIHELYPMYMTLNNLMVGHVPLTFNFIVPEESLHGHRAIPTTFGHITPAVQGRFYLWGELCTNASSSGKEWIRLDVAALGDSGLPGHAWNIHHQPNPEPNLFNNAGFHAFRRWMLESAGISPDHKGPGKPLVVLNDKVLSNGELETRRRIYNIKDVQAHLQNHLPHARVVCVAFMTKPWKQQLEILAKTTVFITTEGSSSFRLVFMPPGASAIILAHPDNLTEGAKPLGSYFGQNFPPFHEVSKYFQFVYLRIYKYSVDVEHTTEYVNGTHLANGRIELYDAHIVLQLNRITLMVEDALHGAMHHRSLTDAGVVMPLS